MTGLHQHAVVVGLAEVEMAEFQGQKIPVLIGDLEIRSPVPPDVLFHSYSSSTPRAKVDAVRIPQAEDTSAAQHSWDSMRRASGTGNLPRSRMMPSTEQPVGARAITRGPCD